MYGFIEDYLSEKAQFDDNCAETTASSANAASAPSRECGTSAAGATDAALSVALDHIAQMKFEFFQTDAEVQRAKEMCHDVLAAIKPAILEQLAALGPVETLEPLIAPILNVIDKIRSAKTEATHRRNEQRRAGLPQLRVYPRQLCKRKHMTSAATSVNAKRKGLADDAYAWETRLEEVLERELAYDPNLLGDILAADVRWTEMNRSMLPSDDPERKIVDVCDGSVWAQHPYLGDPAYDGPPRLAFSGYCDDVDVTHPIGPSAGHHKLYLSYLILLNRAPNGRMRLVNVNLASVCLASDTKLVGPDILISGHPNEDFDSTSIGATFRRFNDGVVLRTPPCTGLKEIRVRGWLLAWSADGMAAGAIFGTNSSFSKAWNICNLCENGFQTDVMRNHTPTGFLRCRCPEDDDSHRPGCSCHFRLRTPKRDAKRKAQGCTQQTLRRLGITTEEHGFVRVPYVHASRLGPKDVMHVFFEGVSRHFAACILFMFYHAGWATQQQIKHRVAAFDYGNGVPGFDRPGYIPDSIFVKTRVTLADGTEIWGPHKEAKLGYSAYGTLIFLVHSIEVLRPFLPQNAMTYKWWQAWVLHYHVIVQLLRLEYSYQDLLKLEDTVIAWQAAFFAVPEFHHCWLPKHHWALHAAHDIWRWGPPRLLWCMIYEMKNAHFKRGCKRGNFHDPVKTVAMYYVDYSAHALKRQRSHNRVCHSTKAAILAAGYLNSQPNCAYQAHMRSILNVTAEEDVFVEHVSYMLVHGMHVNAGAYVLYDCAVFRILHILRVAESHLLWVVHRGEVAFDDFGCAFVVEDADVRNGINDGCVLLSVENTPGLCFVWAFSDELNSKLVRLVHRW